MHLNSTIIEDLLFYKSTEERVGVVKLLRIINNAIVDFSFREVIQIYLKQNLYEFIQYYLLKKVLKEDLLKTTVNHKENLKTNFFKVFFAEEDIKLYC